ncbi:MAG: methyltransferase type 11 [Spirochaetes bacterium]|nr:MAG: methyltransferase type 11 [Spirochaetota bacterium]
MHSRKTIEVIARRYGNLAESSCCLSCGQAADYSHPAQGEVCLDIGSGRGTDVLRLAEQVGDFGFVYGLDISDGMIEKAKKTAARLNVKNVAFLKSRLEEIPLESNSFDLVISNCTINHAEDKQALWDEIFRVLKPGGRFVISDIYSIEKVPVKYTSDLQAVAECWGGAVTRDIYLQTVKKAGFSGIEILEKSAPYSKGEIEVASFTLKGRKPAGGCCCK